MKKYQINGKSMDSEEAKALLETDTKVSNFVMEIENEGANTALVTDEGCDFDKAFFKSLLGQKDKMNAKMLNMRFEGVKVMLNNTLTIILSDPGLEVHIHTIGQTDAKFKRVLKRGLLFLLRKLE